MQTIGLVLAAGLGTRMKSTRCKVMHAVCGKPMIGHVIDTLEQLKTDRNVIIVGHGAEQVQSYVGERADYVMQQEQLGTGHAVMQARELLQHETGTVIVTCGDAPLIQASSLQQMLQLHERTQAACTILTAAIDDPHGYGRIVRNSAGEVTQIVEQKDCTAEQNLIREINTGTFCFDVRKLFAALSEVSNDNAQNEYYLTDCIGILREQGETIQAYCLEDYRESIGVNDRIMLAEAERIMQQRINAFHQQNGVTIIDPQHTYIEADVTIGKDTTIYPGTYLSGSTAIGEHCIIGPYSDIGDSVIADFVEVKHSVVREARIDSETTVGPYAHLRPGTKLATDVRIGDFVEIKNASIGQGSRISHLSYVGDAEVGQNVNIGCGAITVNFDGFHKHKTEIGDNVFIGSNVNLIAPLKIGDGAFVVAGSTVTNDVQANGFAIARARQTTKPDYADRIRNRIKARHSTED